MKNANANAIRASIIENLLNHMTDYCGEDCGMIASNSFNFPVVVDGEEGWIEIVVKVPKDDEGYEKREEYEIKCRERADKAAKAAEAKAKKIAKDKKKREEAE